MPLVLTMMLGAVLAAFASAMVLVAMTETAIAGAYRDGTTLFYAAEGAAEFALDELARSEWGSVLDTHERSTLINRTPGDPVWLDGPAGYHLYADGRIGDLVGRPSSEADPYIVVWIADITGPEADPATSERSVGVVAAAFGRLGARRAIVLTARLTASDEDVTVERLSWTQE